MEDQLNAKGEDFGRARVQKVLKKRGTQSPKCIAAALFAEIDAHRDDTRVPTFMHVNVNLRDGVPARGWRRGSQRSERCDLRILHDRIVGDDANRTVALHDDEVFALRRTQLAHDVQIVIDRRRSGAGENGTTEQCC